MSEYAKNNHCVNITKSATVEQAENAPGTDFPVAGAGIVRAPRVLGVYEVTSHLSANITFDDPVLEIKDIKKRVEIIQCRLMTDAATMGTPTSAGVFPLFIEGYVRKNIQYASPCYNESGECISSEMKSLTTRVPFKVTTMVDLTGAAVLPVLNQRSEYDFAVTRDLGPGHPEKDHFHSSDLSQFHQQSTQFYNDLPYCELVSHSINQWDEATDRELLNPEDPSGEGFFHNILEKMMLSFTVRVLQVQSLDLN